MRFSNGEDPELQPDSGEAESPGGGIAIFDILGALVRRWWIVVIAVVIAGGYATWKARNLVPQYTASALVRKRPDERASILGVGPRAIPMNFQTEDQLLHSQAVIGTAVRTLGLRVRVDSSIAGSQLIAAVETTDSLPAGRYSVRAEGDEFVLSNERGDLARGIRGGWLEAKGIRVLLAPSAPAPPTPVWIDVAPLQPLIQRVKSRLAANQEGNTDLIHIRYTDEDAATAAAIANQVAAAYSQFDGRESRREASGRLQIIEQQLAQVSDSLETVRGLLLQHQAQAGMIGADAFATDLLSTEQRFQQLRDRQARLQNVISLLRSNDTSDEAFRRIAVLGDDILPGAQDFYSRMKDLETERRRLTASRFGYTENESRVVVLDSMMAANRNELLAIAEQTLRLVGEEMSRAQGQVSTLRGQLSVMPARSARAAELTQSLHAVQNMYDQLANKLYEAQIAAGGNAGRVEIVDLAMVPTTPTDTGKRRRLMMALMMGLLVGSLGAVGLDRIDSRIVRSGEAERLTGLVAMGMIPRVRSRGSTSGRSFRLVGDSELGAREAYRMLRTSMRFAVADPPRVISITSASPGEGKSSVAANLARVMAEEGSPTLLIDADMRRPVQDTTFGVKKVPGLSDVLVGNANARDVIHPTDVKGLFILAAGSSSPRPSELLGSDKFAQFVTALRDKFSHIIIDTPPVLAVTDTAVLASTVDAVLMVVRVEHTPREALERANFELRKVGAPVLGLVLNYVPQGGAFSRYGRYYGYYQYYGYSEYYQSNGADSKKGLKGRLGRMFSHSG